MSNSSISEGLRLLGKTDLLLAVHDASFPGVEGQDTGRGTPYGHAGDDLAFFARSLGFTGLQLGPQGQTSPANPSPYDGTLFSRSILSLDLKTLIDQRLLSQRTGESILSYPLPNKGRADYLHAFDAINRALDEVYHTFVRARTRGDSAALSLDQEIKILWSSARWLRDDALYEALSFEHGNLPWRQWPQQGEAAVDRVLCAPPSGLEQRCDLRRAALEVKYSMVMERYSLGQLLLLRQHQAFRERLKTRGLKIYGDVQVGFSLCDGWSLQSLLLKNYCMGAPPSRTNTEGQPWGYQVLNPALYQNGEGRPGPVLEMIAERLDKMLFEFDGLRLDHPHGLVCPWVYQADDPDPYHAVQNGARLFSSPDLPDHPELARYSIVRPDQLDRSRPRYADGWVSNLSSGQVHRYALILDTLMEQVITHGRRKEDILCEVLSTEPFPLRQVRLRHGLGRFRVTQKADLGNTGDVYRSENAEAQDWIMVGNHDTPTIWRLVKGWHGREEGMKQAAYLARKLSPAAPDAMAAILAADPRRLAHAKVADLFLSPARHIMIFFADLFGLEDNYNVPGVLNQENWTLRVPPDFSRFYEEGKTRGTVLNLYAVLALALRARPDIVCPELIARLESRAGWKIVP